MKTVNVITNTSIIVIAILFSLITACAPFQHGETSRQGRAGGPLINGYYHYSCGVLFMLDGEIDKAVEEYEKALWFDPESACLLSELAALYIKKGEVDAAVRLLEKSVTSNPEHIDSHILLGSLYGNLGKYDDALREYNKVIEIDPENLEAYLFLSRLYHQNRNYDKAIDVLGNLMKIDSRNLMGCYYLAKVYAAMMNYDEAEIWFQETLEIKPAFRPALMGLGVVYRSQNKNDKELELYSDFLRANPSNSEIRFEMGNTLMRLKRYDAAAEEFEKILKMDNSLVDVHFSLGLAYLFGEKQGNRAIGEFLTVLELRPDHYRAIYFLATVYEEKEQYADAMKELETIPEKSTLYTAARIRMGFILKDEGNTSAAIKLIRVEIEKKNKDIELYRFMAAVYEEAGRFKDAEDILTKGLTLLPQDIGLHYSLGMLYGRRHEYRESIEEMETVLKLDPYNADAINFIGYSYADRGIRLDEAEKLVQRALSLKPDKGYIMDSLGWVYFKQNKVKLAIKYLKRAWELLPEDPVIAGHLGDAYEMDGRKKEALNVYERALGLNPGNEKLKKKIKYIRIPSE